MTDSAASAHSHPDPDTDWYDYVRSLIKDSVRLREAIEDGRQHVDSLLKTLHGLLTPRIGFGLLHGLALSEIARSIEMSVKTIPSDLCGQARFLRGLIVSGPLDPDGVVEAGPAMDEAWPTMLETIEELWRTFFWLEQLQAELVKNGGTLNEQQVDEASMAAAYGRSDIDIGFVEPVESRCRSVFTSLDQKFVIPTFGVGVDRLVTGFPAIMKEVQKRLNLAVNAARKQTELPSESQPFFLQKSLDSLLEITIADLPATWTQAERQAFLDAFSLMGGEHHQSFASPAHDNITLRKPLLRLSGGRYYLMDPLFCRYAPNRLLCHAVEVSPYRDRYLRLRDEALEELAGQLFKSAIHPMAHYAGVYLPVGDNNDLAEQDHIFLADGHIFFIECKAKRVRNPTAHGGNVSKVKDDLRASIQTGFEQGDRARRHVMASKDRIPIFNKYGKTVAEIDRGTFHSAHVVVVTWESLCPLSVDLAPWLDVAAGTEYPWVVWVDDLQTALTRLKPAAEIAKFVSWRSSLNGKLVAGDEMHVVGCFLAVHTVFPSEYETILIDDSYAHIFDDDYFASKGVQREVKPPDPQPALVELRNEDGRLTVRHKNKVNAPKDDKTCQRNEP